MIVKFLKSHGVYGAGETAGFHDDQARALIAAGKAEEVVKPAPVAAVAGPAPVTKPVPASKPRAG